jgi:transcription elongation GreA/GreB family factor
LLFVVTGVEVPKDERIRLTQFGHDLLVAKQKRLRREHDDLARRDKRATASVGAGDLGTIQDGCEVYERDLRRQIYDIDVIFKPGVEIVPEVKQTERVQIGQIVSGIKCYADDEKQVTYWIDGWASTDPDWDPPVYGYYAPAIRPLIGKQVGDVVTIKVFDEIKQVETTYDFEITKIELPPAALCQERFGQYDLAA